MQIQMVLACPLSRKIIDNYGGQIWFESEVGAKALPLNLIYPAHYLTRKHCDTLVGYIKALPLTAGTSTFRKNFR